MIGMEQHFQDQQGYGGFSPALKVGEYEELYGSSDEGLYGSSDEGLYGSSDEGFYDKALPNIEQNKFVASANETAPPVQVPTVDDASTDIKGEGLLNVGGSQPWGGILGSTQWGKGISKKFGDFGKKGGLLGMAMKGMGVEGAGDMMSQFTGAMQGGGAAGGQPQYVSNVQNAANVMPQAFQNPVRGSFY